MATRRNINGAKESPGPDKESPFINLPWAKAQDEAFEEWLLSKEPTSSHVLLDSLIEAGVSVKIGFSNKAIYATLQSPEPPVEGVKNLLSGWSDGWEDALAVAYFKWDKLLLRDFSHPTAGLEKSRRR